MNWLERLKKLLKDDLHSSKFEDEMDDDDQSSSFEKNQDKSSSLDDKHNKSLSSSYCSSSFSDMQSGFSSFSEMAREFEITVNSYLFWKMHKDFKSTFITFYVFVFPQKGKHREIYLKIAQAFMDEDH